MIYGHVLRRSINHELIVINPTGWAPAAEQQAWKPRLNAAPRNLFSGSVGHWGMNTSDPRGKALLQQKHIYFKHSC